MMLLATILVVAPWTIRNAVALDRFVPISTGGGQVLFAGTYLPSGGDPERVGAEVVIRHPGLFDPVDARELRLEQILARLAAQRYPGMETDKALAKIGREQLWDDISKEPLEYAGFLATKVGRVWFRPAREVMRAPGWHVLQWALVLLGLVGLVVLALPRGTFVAQRDAKVPHAPWQAAVLATVIVAITAISALLVASPRRALVMLPLVASLAGVSATWLFALLHEGSRRSSRTR